jgi:hypothetical protein
LHRRTILLGVLATATGACVHPRPRTEPTSAASSLPMAEAWNDEARAILGNALEVLRTFDTYAAYRISAAETSSLQSSWEFSWDPPSAAAWEAAAKDVQGLRERALHLHGGVVISAPDPALWRERRAFADATLLVVEMVDSLAGYRARVDRLPPYGDGSSALPVLQRAWELWSSAAGHWGVRNWEVMTCA